MSNMRGEPGLVLEVIAGMNLAIPSNRIPAGLYVLVSTSYGQCNTTSKAAMADCSVTWNQALTIHGRPLKFPRWLMPIFSRKSKAVHLEIRASFESAPMLGRGELVATFETTFKRLLGNDGRPISLSAVDNQRISLELKARHSQTTHITNNAAGGTEQSAIGHSTDAARDAYILLGRSNVASDLDNQISSNQHSERHHDQGSVVQFTGMSVSERKRSPPQLSPPASLSNCETRAGGRNVVIFGETGVGKSSIINTIAQKELAKTSNDAPGCTSSSERYPVEISSQRFVLLDTAGLNEGNEGTVPAAKAEKQLKSLLRELMSSGSDGIGLLVYCAQHFCPSRPRSCLQHGVCWGLPEEGPYRRRHHGIGERGSHGKLVGYK